jgi:phage-related protein
MIVLLILLAAAEPQLPAVTCDQVRAFVAEHGTMRSVYWARSQGYSWRQIAEAKRCLRATSMDGTQPRP